MFFEFLSFQNVYWMSQLRVTLFLYKSPLVMEDFGEKIVAIFQLVFKKDVFKNPKPT